MSSASLATPSRPCASNIHRHLQSRRAVDLGSLDDNRAAEVSEDVDRLTGRLRYLKGAFETSYGVKYVPTTPQAENDPMPMPMDVIHGYAIPWPVQQPPRG